MSPDTTMIALTEQRIVPLATPTDVIQTINLREGLILSGMNVVEVGLRDPYSITALSELAKYEDLIVGAGTVLDAHQAEQALAAGARFLITPGFAEDVLDFASVHRVPIILGVATASEVLRAHRVGQQIVKLFPAHILGGLDYIDALSTVFPDMQFVPSGGVSDATLAQHLNHHAVSAVSGTWLTNRAMLDSGSEAIAEAMRKSKSIAERQLHE